MASTILIILVAFCAGYLSNILFSKKFNSDGDFIIDTSDDDVDKYMLNVNTPLGDLAHKKYMILKIVVQEKQK